MRTSPSDSPPSRASGGDPGRIPDLESDRRRLDAWMLRPDVAYLNHGSFGARPRDVVAHQQAHRADFEAEPIDWLDRRRDELIDLAKAQVGRFLGVSPAHFGFVSNASAAVCAVLRSIELEAGDEILTTDHAYGAVRRTIEHVCRRAGAVPVVASVPVPVSGPEEVVEAVDARITPRTRLLVVDHVTSPTAIVLPVERIVAAARRRGIRVLVDGAHAPGMLELDVTAIGADWYAGNLHKWVCAPVGAAFLHADPDAPRVHPPIISHFHEGTFTEEFAWQGTRDITPWLSVPFAIDWMSGAGGTGGWSAVRAANVLMAADAADVLAGAWGTPITAPASMRGSMAAVAVPERWERAEERPELLRDRLFREHRVEVPIIDVAGRWHARVSAHLYNRREQYERLADLLA